MANERKWALITGATGGLGRAFAGALVRRGYNLVLTARKADALEAMATELRGEHGAEVVVEAVDLAEALACTQLKQRIDNRGIFVETLVANAGYGIQGRFIARSRDDEVGMVDVNVRALTELSHIFAGDMADRAGGHILLVASTAAFQPIPGYAVYAASKAYVLAFGHALHRELARRKVVVSVTCPGPTQTPFWERAGHRLNPMAAAVMMTPEAVVEAGLNALYAGRPSVVPGVVNKLITLLTRLFPRSLLALGASFFMSNAK
ncbi:MULTISPECIES: SDR family NAD(P)-dependent oxidoreductase [Alphaproteobacteria]|uniref:Short-chain dehydrogenase n=2 Tax=Alphaproteobacteria TaxID=28211 RepID=A0A512HGJ8_9HYPH|nr:MULTISPECIES: SDR family oxidoreductase [Alphaproteobacteria]GEO84577.1 short-chain dehydrogenase [Ciceribacter naphthalenivorans]GLR22540.1 short-chain dehydrogenase [Ciceribacter naphthalenivorans]GLT05396.1 short-chain dehydrogenase [Sphingomonas psychrolutea]